MVSKQQFFPECIFLEEIIPAQREAGGRLFADCAEERQLSVERGPFTQLRLKHHCKVTMYMH